MAVHHIIESISRDFVTDYYQGLESSAVHTAPPVVLQSVHGCSSRSLPRRPLHMQAQVVIPTFFTSNIYIGLCIPEALTLTPLRSYKIFQVLLIVRTTTRVGLRGILNFHLLRDAYPYRLARRMPIMQGVP